MGLPKTSKPVMEADIINKSNIKSGIKKVVIAMKDPNPINCGRGIAKLKRAGLKTEYGLLEKKSSALNRPFIKFMKNHLPYVTLKMAQSMDGKIADAKGRSKWITSLSSRQLAHKLRARNDAVMIGINTLLKDDPLLNSRTSEQNGRQPLRIVLDTNLRTPLQSRILKNNKLKCGEVLIVSGMGAPLKKKALLEKKGAKVILLQRKDGHIDLVYLMKYLARINVMSVVCEGGGELAASLLKDKLVDETFFFISPRIIGGKTSPTSCGGSYSDIRKSIRLKDISVRRIGPDILIRGSL